MIGDIAYGSVNWWSSAWSDIRKSRYTNRKAWKQHRNNSENPVEIQSNAIFQGNLDFIILGLWVKSTQ